MKNLTRIPLIDFLRGLAVIMMIIFHFNFDLSSFRITSPDFYKNEFWLGFRLMVMIIFVTLVGVSLVLADSQFRQKSFWKRNFKILMCALLVSVGSYLLLPDSFIYFGVLHFIFLASLIGCLLAAPQWAWLNLIVGIFLILLARFYHNTFFDQSYLNWIGFTTHNPLAEDYVPMIPWLGLVLIGIFIAHKILPRIPPSVLNFDIRAVSWLGKRSLLIYLIHQPILIGLFIIYIKTR